MGQHFDSFTAEGMRALAQDVMDGQSARASFTEKVRSDAQALREDARAALGRLKSETQVQASQLRDRLAAHAAQRATDERERRGGASRNREARRVAASELRSGVHALLGRFQLDRKAVAQDLRGMAIEFKAASDAWRSRGRFVPIKAQPETKHQAPHKQSAFVPDYGVTIQTVKEPAVKEPVEGSKKKT